MEAAEAGLEEVLEEGSFLPRREMVYRLGSWPSRRMISGKIRLRALINQLHT